MNDQQLVHIMQMGAETLQKLINRNRKLDSEINNLKLKYQQDVQQIRKVADELMKQISVELNQAEKKDAEDEAKRIGTVITKAEARRAQKSKYVQWIDPEPVIPKQAPWHRIALIPGLNVRTYAAFKKLGLVYVKDFKRVTEKDLIMDNVGHKTIAQIKHVMKECGYPLVQNDSNQKV